MSARQRQRRHDRKRLAKAPPPAVVRRPVAAAAQPLDRYDTMSADALKTEVLHRLLGLAERRVIPVELLVGPVLEHAQRLPRSVAGGPLQAPPRSAIVKGPMPKSRAPRTVRP